MVPMMPAFLSRLRLHWPQLGSGFSLACLLIATFWPSESPADTVTSEEKAPAIVEFVLYQNQQPADTIHEHPPITLKRFLPIRGLELVYYARWLKEPRALLVSTSPNTTDETHFSYVDWTPINPEPRAQLNQPEILSAPRGHHGQWQEVCYSRWPMTLPEHQKQTMILRSQDSCEQIHDHIRLEGQLNFTLKQFIDVQGTLKVIDTLHQQPNQGQDDYMIFNRRAKYDQLNYIDHPRYGMIIVIHRPTVVNQITTTPHEIPKKT